MGQTIGNHVGHWSIPGESVRAAFWDGRRLDPEKTSLRKWPHARALLTGPRTPPGAERAEIVWFFAELAGPRRLVEQTYANARRTRSMMVAMDDDTSLSEPRLGVAVVGAGYWGPNLIRNFSASEACELLWVCDLDERRAAKAAGRNTETRITASLDDVLNDERVTAVAIATPAGTHAAVGMACLEAGRHVLVEKPLADSVADGEKLVEGAEERGLVLMCDHTYCYTPAVQRIRDYMDQGALGDLQYIDSVRINLGLLQHDIDVVWDLAPHDLSVFDFLLPDGNSPTGVAAHGADPFGSGRVSIAYLALPLGGNAIAHAHVNWLSPTKVRTMIIGGSRRMLVWDDLHPTQRISLYDKGVEMSPTLDSDARRRTLISYRVGDVISPALPEYEALGAVISEFVSAIREDRPARTDGRSGLRVLRILEAASASLTTGGEIVALDDYRQGAPSA